MATKDAVLQALQNSEGAFLSGEELSNKLSVSRTTVWKAIKALREEGHPIEAVTNRGYMLMSDSWTITEDSLRACLPAKYRKAMAVTTSNSVGESSPSATMASAAETTFCP